MQQEVWDELGKIVGLYKDHPVTLAWLTNDELPIGNVPEAEATYRFFRERDPDHPVRCVIDQPQNIRAFLGTCDNASTDPYPIGNWRKPPIGFAGEATRITREQSFGIRSMWQVVQAFDWKWYRRGESPERLADWGVRMPTADEMRDIVIRNVRSRAGRGVCLRGVTGAVRVENVEGFDGCPKAFSDERTEVGKRPVEMLELPRKETK